MSYKVMAVNESDRHSVKHLMSAPGSAEESRLFSCLLYGLVMQLTLGNAWLMITCLLVQRTV